MNKKLSLTVAWMYPDLMSTYGDRGNILVLQRRCEWRGIKFTLLPIDQQSTELRLKSFDVLFGGGSQDKEQALVMDDLKGRKAEIIKEKIEEGTPALFVCGAPQLMGKYYEPSSGNRIEGLGIFDMVSVHPGPADQRLIGNAVAKMNWGNLQSADQQDPSRDIIVGFENHGGRTYLGKNAKSFAQVIKGFGNNGKDGTEGVVYKNAIGCYFHGPLLPKNPQVADFLIERSLEVKYKEKFNLEPLDDSLELKAKSVIAKRIGVTI